jgi:hypothetical protein
MSPAEAEDRSEVHRILVGGATLPTPQGLLLKNYLDPQVRRFEGRHRSGPIDEAVVHESAIASAASTVRALSRRGLGVHLMVAPDGTVTQHGDLANDLLAHAGRHNRRSVGVEVVTPYYPDRLLPDHPWSRVIEARWAHRGRYVLPTPAQAEAVALLIGWLTSSAAVGLEIPRRWIGLDGTRMAMGRVPGADRPRPGIAAHTYWHHADGAWLALYAWLRLEARLDRERAYAEAIDRATMRRRHVDLADLMNPNAA